MNIEVAYIGNKGSHAFAGNGPAYNANEAAIGSGTDTYSCTPNGNGTFNCKAGLDRKSTRLNSSHRCISYAVFCLKKKKPNNYKSYRHEIAAHCRKHTSCPG